MKSTPDLKAELEDDPYESSAQWMQELGRRTSTGPRPSFHAPNVSQKKKQGTGRAIVGFGALSLAFLQFYFLDVLLQIQHLPALVLFVPPTLA